MTLQPGTTVGRYQILEPLGQGGMATVYKAFQPSLQREVALKVLRPGYAQDEEFRSRFEREAIAIAKLRHPHIVQVFDFEIAASGEYVLAMEFLEGGTLKDRLTGLAGEGRGMDPDQAARIVGEVAEALSYAHEKGIVHRDVKPSNVMLTHKDRAVVTDFGIARILGATSHTQTGVGIGTPEYMAPEQGQGSTIDHRADIYSLGAMAYELLTGRVPYSADTPLAVVLAHIKDPLPLPSKANPTIGKSVERALLKALAKDPAQRFDSATAFADALKAGLVEDSRGGTMPTVVVRGPAGATPSARTHVAPAKRAAFLRAALARRPVAFGLAGALVVAVVAGSVLVSGALRPTTTAGPGAEGMLPARGALVWQAKLDGTQADVRDVPGGPPGSSADEATVRFVPGAIEYVVTKATTTGSRVFLLNAPAREAFVLELDIDPAAAFNVTTTWWEANDQRYDAVASLRGSTVRFQYSKPLGASADTLATSGPVDAVRRGNRFTFAVVVDRSRFSAFVDGREVLQGTPDGRVPPASAPIKLGFSGSDPGTLRLTGIRLYELPAGTAQAVSSPSAKPTTAGRGALVWQARLDGTDIDTRGAPSLYINATEDSSSVRFAPGAIEFVVNKAPTGRNISLNSPIRETFFLEVDIDARVIGQLAFGWWGTGSNPQFRLISDLQQSRMEFQYYHTRVTTQALSASTAAPDVRSGAPFTAALAVEKDRFTAFANGRQIVEVAADPRIAPAAAPLVLSFGVSSGTQTGVVRVTGIRLYELMSNAAAASPSGPAPTPKFAIPAKGKLLYEAKLDGSGADLRPRQVDKGSASESDVRFGVGSIDFSVSANGASSKALLPVDSLRTFVGEIELSRTSPNTRVDFRWHLRMTPGGGHIVTLDIFPGEAYAQLVLWEQTNPQQVPLTAPVPLPKLAAGMTTVIAVVVDADRYTIFVDQSQVAQAQEAKAPGPSIPQLGIWSVGGTGGVRVSGLRLYALP